MVILVSSSSSLSLLSSAVNDMYSSSESDVGMVVLVMVVLLSPSGEVLL